MMKLFVAILLGLMVVTIHAQDAGTDGDTADTADDSTDTADDSTDTADDLPILPMIPPILPMILPILPMILPILPMILPKVMVTTAQLYLCPWLRFLFCSPSFVYKLTKC